MKLHILLLILTCFTGCANNFGRVDFKYSNLDHMNHQEGTIKISTPPEDFIFDITAAFRNNGANIIIRKKIDYVLTENTLGQQCWEAKYSISQKEFNAYRLNNFSIYNGIDREGQFSSKGLESNCSYFTRNIESDADSWQLVVEFPPRSAQTTIYRPTMNGFFMFNPNTMTPSMQGLSTSQNQENIHINFSTRLYVWAWKSISDSKTNVYLMAKPVSGQLEANQGVTIGYTWWQYANGYNESQTVKNYISIIQEYDHQKKQ